MKTVDPTSQSIQTIQNILLAAVAPRPIALVSTIDQNNISNLAPFSFFNAFGSNPPFVAFSPARRVRDGTLKDTYYNLMSTHECVVNVVTLQMAKAMLVCSKDFPKDTDEFKESGLTPLPSDLVKALRVKESPIHFECKLVEMVHLGDQPGSGNLAICKIVRFHIDTSLLDQENNIDPRKISHIARNGKQFYTKVDQESLFIIDEKLQTVIA